MCANSSTRIFAAMAIAATWVISTARSPTTWQPNILPVARSTISLQKPDFAPVDDRARGRVEVDDRDHDFVCFTGLCFGQAHLGIFRIREAADRVHRIVQASSSVLARRW